MPHPTIGRRVIVTGAAGAGKSTFARALGARTGLPVIHLDLHAWKPGWVRMNEEELRERHRRLLTGKEWIADGNYHESLDLQLARADTVVVLDTPWWICALRAFLRGLRRPPGLQLPDGCDDNRWRQLRDEWWLVWRIWRGRHSDRRRERRILMQHDGNVSVYVLRSKRKIRRFLQAGTEMPK